MADIINIPVGVSRATQAWTQVPGSTDSVLVWNPDTANFVYIGFNPQVTAGGLNAIPVPPNASFQLPAKRNLFVIGKVQGITPLVVIPDSQGMFRSLTQGLGSLSIPALFSPNYKPGLNGWSINADGSAEFNNLTLRGTFLGADWIIGDSGAFWYQGTPGTGNLSVSIVPGTVAILDPVGTNLALPGITSYFTNAGAPLTAAQDFGGETTYYVWNGAAWIIVADIAITGFVGPTPTLSVTCVNGVEIAGPLQVIGAISAISGSAANPTVITSDTWTNVPAFQPGFAAAAGNPPQYAYNPVGVNQNGSVDLQGGVLLTAACAVDTAMFQVPYTFAKSRDYIVPNNLSGAGLGQRVVRVAASGFVRVEAAGSNGNFVLLDGINAKLG